MKPRTLSPADTATLVSLMQAQGWVRCRRNASYLDFERFPKGWGNTPAQDDRIECATLCSDGRWYGTVRHVEAEHGHDWYTTSSDSYATVAEVDAWLQANRAEAPRHHCGVQSRMRA